MKNPFCFAALLFTLVAGMVLPAPAQRVRIKVTVPFHFMVGDHDYAAGVYEFWAQKEQVITEREGARLTMQLANHVSGPRAGETGKVVFECYGNECFLSQVWIPGQDNGLQLLHSNTEVRVAARRPGKYMALMGTGPK